MLTQQREGFLRKLFYQNNFLLKRFFISNQPAEINAACKVVCIKRKLRLRLHQLHSLDKLFYQGALLIIDL